MPRPTQRTLYWDCETRSTVDLRKAGLYVYASHPTTSVTVARLALDREAPHEWRPGQALPARYIQAMEDHNVRIVAHNSAFERIILRDILAPRHGWPVVPIWRFDCTMARARVQALPGALDGAAMAIGLDVRKDLSGHQLMMRMCRPRSVAPDGTVTWWQDDDRMQRLSDYCATDVKVERALDVVLQPFTESERAVWEQTEVMNDRGVRFDLGFVAAARAVAEETRDLLDSMMASLTAGAVPRCSRMVDLKRYLIGRGVNLDPPPELQRDNQPWMTPVAELLLPDDDDEPKAEENDARESLPDLRRRDIMRLLAGPDLQEHDRAVLRLRLEAGKISTRKLDAIRERADEQGVVRGLLGYHGANTGRYISMGVQIQNFPRETVRDWQEMRELLDSGATLVDALAGPPLDVISKMLRGAIIPRPGHRIMAGDYSSVEAVGLAWLAGQSDLLEAFERREPVYEEMAATVYGRLVADIRPDSIERQVGKTLVLGAGYQMGWWKFRETVLMMCGVLLKPEEAEHAINTYRDTFKRIYSFWWEIEEAAKLAVSVPGRVTGTAGGKIRFLCERAWLRMRLPSGRCLWYAKPLVEANPERDGREMLTYFGVNNKTRKWERQHTYGGRLTENCIEIGTPVLTDRGWQPIETLRLSDRLWDGEAWVSHAGVVAKGEQDIIEVDGVGMTPDHEVLTAKGWIDGASCNGLDRAACRLPDGAVPLWQHEAAQGGVAGALRLRVRAPGGSGGFAEGESEVLRLQEERVDLSLAHDAWHVETSSLCGVAFDDRSLPVADASGMAELRRTGDHGLPEMAGQFRGVLVGHGADIPAGFGDRAHRQLEGLQLGELQVGDAPRASAEQADKRADRHAMGANDGRGGERAQRYQCDDAALSPGSRRRPVFDILDAGPRHRFVVAGDTNLLIVSNCVQGLCRDLLVNATISLETAGYRPITLVHDEAVCEPVIGHGSIDEMLAIMCALPDWAKGFPLSAKGREGVRYSK